MERFSALINKTADKQVKKYEAAAAELFEREAAALETELAQKLESRLKFETERISSATNREISALESNARLMITRRRQEIAQKVFCEVEKRLEAFAASSDYDAFLSASLASLCAELGNCRVFCRQADVERVESLCSKQPGVTGVFASGEIVLGGLFAVSEEGSVVARDTLDDRLEACRERFLSIADLSV